MLYNRVFSVMVGEPGGEAAVLDKIRTRFEIIRTEDEEANTITLDLFNLSRSTRSKFETTDNRVIIHAGYAGAMKLLAIGDIVWGSTDLAKKDFVTTVEAKDGGRSLRDARVSLSYKQDVPARSIVDELVKELHVDGIEISVDLTGTFKYGWSFIGNVRDGLNKLGARFGFTWSIQNNTLQITERRQPTLREAAYISPRTGMVERPCRIDKTDDNRTDDREYPGLRVRCLLNATLLPGDPVVIDSADFPRGVYRIRRVEHQGDTHGRDWTTEIQVIEPGSEGVYKEEGRRKKKKKEEEDATT